MVGEQGELYFHGSYFKRYDLKIPIRMSNETAKASDVQLIRSS